MDKAAKNTTSDILFLYELSLSIGRSMDVAQSCQDFLGLLMSRKEVAFASVWVANDKLPDGGTASEVLAPRSSQFSTHQGAVSRHHKDR